MARSPPTHQRQPTLTSNLVIVCSQFLAQGVEGPFHLKCSKVSYSPSAATFWFESVLQGSVTPTRAPALPTPAPALLDSPRGGAPPAPRKTAVWTAMTPPPGTMTPPLA
ncbi:uncharacterized protein F5147DRAFT_773813 [Suillus discolor]|uniref:Uncharacterized protein n=1 Tax=Suillus discolor TaxID=1912936 RepID=A0A9P7F893_9AGAM|nr:uncharacterized protein F5147DRAFT_773813 [Suillus discolor]KAG2108230.1 hypothetical protein F5147DRAFT_773813 [Suillus discolor]